MTAGAGGTAGAPLVSGTTYTDGSGVDPEFPNTKVPSKAPPATAANSAATMAALRSDAEFPDAATGTGAAMGFGRSIGPYPSYQPGLGWGAMEGRAY
jgi:hypothetical protein